MTRLRRLVYVTALTLPWVASGSAEAQSAAPEASANSDVGDEGDIVVTALKREQRLQDVPMSVTALAGDALLENNQVKIEDYFRSVPGLSLSPLGSGRYNLSIRGVTTGISTSPTVGITIDEVPYGSVSILGFGSRFFPDLDPSDLQRIEILRGPQGTLYGASSLGGLLQYVTIDPSTTAMSGRIQVDGNVISRGGAGGGLRGSVNVPVVESALGIRASGFYRHDGGYIDDVRQGRKDVDRRDVYGGRFAALWEISPGASLKLGALYQHNHGEGTNQIDANYQLKPSVRELAHNALIGTGAYTNIAQLYNANLKIDLGGSLTFDSITGYSINKYRTNMDATASYGAYVPLVYTGNGADLPYAFHTGKFSQEFRLSSSTRLFDWLIGGFFTSEKSSDVFVSNGTDLTTGTHTGVLFDEHDDFKYKEYAVFGDATFHVTPQFDIQAGGRYSSNHQKYRSIVDIPVPVQFLFGPSVDFRQNSSDHAFTFEVSPSYKLSPNTLIYARLSTGYRPGGPNAGDFDAFTPRAFEADKTTNYEVGIKGSAMDRLLTFDLAAYWLNWKNIQLSFHDQTTGFLYLKNASRATSKGIEGSFELRPNAGLLISANASFNEAKLAEDLPAAGSFGLAGDVLPNAPKFSTSLAAEQSFPVSNGLEAFVGGSLSHVSSRRAEFTNKATEIRAELPAYTTGDLRVGVRGDELTVTAFVTNVGDARGILYAGPLGSKATTASPFYKVVIQPRTFGVTLAHQF